MSRLHFDDFSKNLSELPQLNRRHFICSYIKEQKVHAKSYAFEGRAFVSSWNHTQLEVQVPQYHTHNTQALVECGFNTPVLKPRVTELGNPSSMINKRRASNDPIVQGHVSKALVQKEEKKRKRTSTVTTGGIPRSKTRQWVDREKRHSNAGITSSEQYRLKERRERRQAKHVAINPVEPEMSSEPECEKTNKQTEKKGKNRKKEKLKIPPALALMHGFSATNVRSGRLTINHPVGVFNKGKASAQNHVDNKKFFKAQGRPSISFIESAFLTGSCSERRAEKKHNILVPSVFNLDSSTLDQDLIPLSDAEPFFQKSCGEASFSASDTILDQASVVEESIQPLRNITACADSITWDIELDGVSLASRVPSDLERANAILNTEEFSWFNPKVRKCVSKDQDSCADPEFRVRSSETLQVVKVKNNQQRHSSPSIGPSQSASQYVCSEPLASAQSQYFVTSKYFVANRNQPLSPAKFLDVSTVPKPGIGCRCSETLPYNTLLVHGTANNFLQLASPSPPLLTPRNYEEGQTNCGFGKDNNVGCRIGEEFVETGTDSLLCACMNDHDQCWPLKSEEAHSNFTDENGRNSQTSREVFDLQYSESLNDTQADLDYLPEDLGSLAHSVVVPEALGRHPEVWNFEYSEATGSYMSSREDLRYSRSSPGSAEGECLSHVHNEPQEMSFNSNSDCSSFEAGSMGDNVCDHRGSLIYATSQFLQGRRLLLEYLHSDNFGHSLMSTVSQVKGRPPVSLVEADVAKSLKNHWVPQKL